MIVLTAYNDEMAPIGDLTAPLMLQYANKHGYSFHCARFNGGKPDCYWQKISLMVSLLKEMDEPILWLDADQMITNPEWTPDFPEWFMMHASMDWGVDATEGYHFSACGLMASTLSGPFLEDILRSKDILFNHPFPEQTALRMAVQYGNWDHAIKVHPRRVFNAVPIELCPTAPEPWQPGDFCCHLTHVPVEERVAMFHQIQSHPPAALEPTPNELLTTSPITNDCSAHLPGE